MFEIRNIVSFSRTLSSEFVVDNFTFPFKMNNTWILKVFWAPFVDKRTSDLGSYKRWIFSSEMVYAVLIFMVAFLDLNTNFTTIFILIILSFIASATQDIATDALTALSFNHREKSLGNSMQSMGSFTGSLVGGGLLLLHYKLIGWNALLISVSLFVVLALIPLFIYKDKKFTPKHEEYKECLYD